MERRKSNHGWVRPEKAEMVSHGSMNMGVVLWQW